MSLQALFLPIWVINDRFTNTINCMKMTWLYVKIHCNYIFETADTFPKIASSTSIVFGYLHLTYWSINWRCGEVNVIQFTNFLSKSNLILDHLDFRSEPTGIDLFLTLRSLKFPPNIGWNSVTPCHLILEILRNFFVRLSCLDWKLTNHHL